MWDIVRIDGGKEFALLGFMQEYLRHLRHDTSRKPVKSGKSTDVSGPTCLNLFWERLSQMGVNIILLLVSGDQVSYLKFL